MSKWYGIIEGRIRNIECGASSGAAHLESSMQSAYEAVDSPRAAFRSRSRVVGAATFLFAAGALAHLRRTAQRPGAAELLDEVAASSGKPTVHAYADAL